MSVQIEWLADRERFEALAPEWDELAAADPFPFARHAWFRCWWDAYGGDAALAVCTARDDDRLAAALPLMWAGRRLTAMSNVETPVFRPVARDERALAAVAEAAVERGRDMAIGPLPAGDPALEALLRAARERRRLVIVSRAHTSPAAELHGDFDSYRRRTKPQWGTPLERLRRKIRREHDAGFRVVESPRDLERELQAGFELENRGWKHEAGTAILCSESDTAFYRAMAAAFDAHGEVRLSSLTLDGQLVAFDFSLLRGGRLYCVKTAYDEGWRRLAPGLVLRLSILERCADMGLEAHDLLGDRDDWKLKFATDEREHRVCRCFARRPGTALRYAWRRALQRGYRLGQRALDPRRPST